MPFVLAAIDQGTTSSRAIRPGSIRGPAERKTIARRGWALSPLLLSVVLSCATPRAGWAAECVMIDAPLNFCKRCTTVIGVSTHRDTPCVGSADASAMRAPERLLLEAQLTKKPSHGAVAVDGPSWTYSPVKGFSGRDNFTIERDYLKDRQLYVVFLQFNMDVN
jgi:Bacterial Ig domain